VLAALQRLVPLYPHSGQWIAHCGGWLVRHIDGFESSSSDPHSGHAIPFFTGPDEKDNARQLCSSSVSSAMLLDLLTCVVGVKTKQFADAIRFLLIKLDTFKLVDSSKVAHFCQVAAKIVVEKTFVQKLAYFSFMFPVH
jgi:hypothetical protein